MMMWNTTEGGPCFLRPTGSGMSDSPNKELNTKNCVAGVPDYAGNPVISTDNGCKDVWVDDENIVHGASVSYEDYTIEGPYSDDMGEQNLCFYQIQKYFLFPFR